LKRDTPRVALAGILFFLSGAAALVYQVAWQRLLALHSGVGLYSVAVIVAAFMAGLGLGSHLGGRLSTRGTAAASLAAFGGLELLIGAFGAASAFIYYDWLYPRAVHLPSPSWGAVLLHFAALLPPTLLMGMSLPFLVRAVVTDVEGAGRRIGWLYGINVLGAAAGAFAAPWLLLPLSGIPGTVRLAAVANVVAGACALVLAARARRRPATASSSEAVDSAPVEARPDSWEPAGARPLLLWIGLYALSGFVALSLEIVWFRLLDVAVKSTAFTFGTVLSVYLLGSGIGALAAAPLVTRVARPLRAFLLAQCALVALAALAVAVVEWLPSGSWPLDWYVQYWAAYDFFPFGHVRDPATVVRLYVVLPLFLFFVPTVLMGLSFPILQRAVHDDPVASGRRVGALQAANIAGCAAGSLLVGLVLFRVLGTPGTIRMLLLCGAFFALVGVFSYGRQFTLPLLGLLVLVPLVPGPDRLWRRLHGQGADVPVVLFDEDGTGVVAITPDNGDWRLSINGKGNSRLPYGGGHSGDSGHTVLGAVPASVHPSPHRVAIVGLGSGDTVWAASYRDDTVSTTVFEISSPQPRILLRLAGLFEIPDLRRLLEDPRLVIRIEDGRKALEATPDTYDIIEADATWPETAGSGNLYSLEFFRVAAQRLGPEGVMCTWAPTPRVSRTFRTVFPHVLENADGDILVGSPSPIPFAPGDWIARARAGEPYLGAPRVEAVVEALRGLREAPPPEPGSLNRDLYPRDEFAVPEP